MIKEKTKIRTFLFVGLTICVFVYPDIVKANVTSSLERCALQLIPSIFPMLVISRMLYHDAVMLPYSFQKIITRVFSMPTRMCDIILCGLVCGFPSPAIIASEKYKSGEFSKEDLEYSIPFFNNSSPAFCIFFIGGYILSSYALGVVLYIINTLAIITVLKMHKRHFCQAVKIKSESHSDFTESVRSSSKVMLEICGFVVFFSVISGTLYYFLSCFNIPSYISSTICGMLEITCGLQTILGEDFMTKFVLCNIINSFGGLSALFQVKSAATEIITSTNYVLTKLKITSVSLIYSIIFIVFYEKLFT